MFSWHGKCWLSKLMIYVLRNWADFWFFGCSFDLLQLHSPYSQLRKGCTIKLVHLTSGTEMCNITNQDRNIQMTKLIEINNITKMTDTSKTTNMSKTTDNDWYVQYDLYKIFYIHLNGSIKTKLSICPKRPTTKNELHFQNNRWWITKDEHTFGWCSLILL